MLTPGHIFHFSHYVIQLQNFCFSSGETYFSLCCFPDLLNCLYAAHQTSFKIAVLGSLLAILQIPMSVESVTLEAHWWCYISLIFHVPCACCCPPIRSRAAPPAFTNRLGEINTHLSTAGEPEACSPPLDVLPASWSPLQSSHFAACSVCCSSTPGTHSFPLPSQEWSQC